MAGYLYCLSNPSMPGILKVGMTSRTPPERLKEANSSDTFRPPTPYLLEFAKHVFQVKEKILHEILDKYTERVHPRREFFRSSLEEIKLFFKLIDGIVWIDPQPPIKNPLMPEPDPPKLPPVIQRPVIPNPPKPPPRSKPPRRRRSYSPSMRTRIETNEVYHPMHQGIPI